MAGDFPAVYSRLGYRGKMVAPHHSPEFYIALGLSWFGLTCWAGEKFLDQTPMPNFGVWMFCVVAWMVISGYLVWRLL